MHEVQKQKHLISAAYLIAKAAWKEQEKAKNIIHVISRIA